MSKSTRVLNISPKAQLAITDNIGSVYPSILRTGDERTLGNYKSIYDDSGVQVFSKQNVLMPYNAEKKFIDNLGFLTGSIYLEKAPTPASQFLTPYKDEKYKPYDEARNQSSFFESVSVRNEGFDENLYQGFTSPISSKIAIPIDISIKQNVNVKIVGDAKDGVTSSPFVYYNFDNQTWDEIGPTDPATGKLTGYVHLIDGFLYTEGASTWISASNSTNNGVRRIVKQFTSSPGIGTEITSFIGLVNQGYSKIGYPTSFFEAPTAKKYHAKKTQSLKLSNFITSPFVLEKIQVKLPVKSERYQNPTFAGTDPKGAGRDIDNCVFFLYRQNRQSSFTDAALDVSSSVRSLIGNESFCFYNEFSMPAGLGPGTHLSPIHENQLEISYDAPITGPGSTGTYVAGPVILDMVFTPKTYEQQFTAASAIGVRVGLGNTFTTGYVQNYWDGGQKNVKNYTTDLRSFPKIPQAIRTFHARGNNQFLYTTSSGLNTPDCTYQFDSRVLRSSTAFTSVREIKFPFSYFGSATTSPNIEYRKNLYVLMPEDELIFGIDAGHFPTYRQDPSVTNSGAPSDLPVGYQDLISAIGDIGKSGTDTISQLTILAGEAKVILYGSLIKENSELLGSLNQRMTSPAIHEDIHQVITDNFQINETSLYAGSYISYSVTGSIGSMSNPRGRSFILDGTLSRLVTLSNYVNNTNNSELDPAALNFDGLSFAINKTTAKHPVSKFRYDKFGQFRDMLEQRRDTKSTEEILVSKNFSIPNFVKTFGSAPFNSPVMVSFVSQSSTTPALPIETRSGNLSFECTSSIPYVDDGIPRNRPDIIFGKNPPFSVKTIILGKGSSLLSTT